MKGMPRPLLGIPFYLAQALPMRRNCLSVMPSGTPVLPNG